ncbi:hypothetical protein ACGFRB_11275 [Streptomyces sp. NPDC048718]|uniref:hypothetical protein n=1 Tax=Streptomyces sp. NPDC048718 TaxID=3365587 RepID=UPI0037165BFE
MPRSGKKPRRLVADGHVYLWRLAHRHDVPDGSAGRPENCREILTLRPEEESGAGSPTALRVVFAEEPGRYVPGGAYLGSGDVGFVHGDVDLNLHEPGAVRALLDEALARGWRPGCRRVEEIDGWTLLAAAVERRAAGQAVGPSTGRGAGQDTAPSVGRGAGAAQGAMPSVGRGGAQGMMPVAARGVAGNTAPAEAAGP